MSASKSLKITLQSTTALVGAAVVAAHATQAMADTTTINTATTANISIAAGDHLRVLDGGSITGTNPAVDVTNVVAGHILNNGIISGTTTGVLITTSADLTGGINNNGLIFGTTYGILIDNASDLSGQLDNSGTISGASYGVSIDGTSDLSGGVLNTGTISGSNYGVAVQGSSDLSGGIDNKADGIISGGNTALAVWTNSDLSGGVENSGMIGGGSIGIDVYSFSDISGGIENKADATISGTNQGIYIQTNSDISGGIDNAGMIFGSTTGIYVSGSDISGGVDNSGTISGSGSYGINVDNTSDISGGIDNSGLIFGGNYGVAIQGSSDMTGAVVNEEDATISGGSTALAVWTNSDLSGGVTNAGTIGGGSIGIDVSNSDISGGVTNTEDGVISGTNQGFYIQSGADVSGGIDNAGTIQGSNTAGTAGTGIYMNTGSDIFGGLANSGTISGGDIGIYLDTNADISGGIDNTATGSIVGGETGIYIESGSDIFGGINNAGLISGSTSIGIRIDTASDISGGVTNSGTIFGGSYGFYIDSASIVTGAITNEVGGLISGGDTGIRVYSTSDISGGIVNAGTITGGSYGILVNGGTSADISGGIDNQAGGVISGSTAIAVTSGNLSGGIDNAGTIEGLGGTAIWMDELQSQVDIDLAGGRIIGDVIDDDPANGFSVVQVSGDFATEGDFDVSDLTVDALTTLTISAGDTVTLDDMSVSAGTFDFEVDSTASFGTLVVNAGDVDLTGATVTVNVGIGNLVNGDELLIADGFAAITGGPGAVATAVVDNSFLWSFDMIDGTGAVAATDNTDLFLQVTQDFTMEAAGTNTNNSNVGAVLDTLLGTADPELQLALANVAGQLTQDGVNEALEALQPTVDGGEVMAALDVSNDALGLVDDQLADLRTGIASGMAAGSGANGLRGWLQVFGRSAEQDRRGGIDGYDADSAGVAFGVDTQNVGENSVLGLAFSYANTDVDSDNANRTETDIDSYQVTLYGSHDLDETTYVNGMLAYVFGDNETTRHDVVPGLNANGDFNSNQFAVRVGAGRDYQHNDVTLTPSVMAHYAHYNAEGYTETGAGGLNLTVDTDSINVFELGAGIDASWNLKNSNGSVLRPNLHLGYRHDLVGDEVDAVSSFAGGGGNFATQGPDPANGTFDAGVGVKYFSNDNWEYTASYNYEMKSDYDAHEGYLRAGYRF